MSFNELMFFSRMKERSGMFIGKKSILSLRDYIGGIYYIAHEQNQKDTFRYLDGFIDWYAENYIKDGNGYAAWWNHILYTSGNYDDAAFDRFFRFFEKYLNEVHGLSLPEAEFL